MTAVGTSSRSTQSEATFSKIQTVSCLPSDSIVLYPTNVRRVHPTLKNQIFYQVSNGVINQRGDNRGVHSKTSFQSARDVIFPPSFPRAEVSRAGNPVFSRIQAEHHFAQSNQIPSAS